MISAQDGLRRKAPRSSAGTMKSRGRVQSSRMEERTRTTEALNAVGLVAGSPLALVAVFALPVPVVASRADLLRSRGRFLPMWTEAR